MSSGTGIAFELSSHIAKRSLITKGTQETPKGRHFRWRGHHFRSWKLREKGTFQVYLQYINAWYIKLISDSNSNLSEIPLQPFALLLEAETFNIAYFF